MGLTPFACIPLPDCTRVVYPDGHVDSLHRPCSASEVLRGNKNYYVCANHPHNFHSRLPPDEVLEIGVTYFVCVRPEANGPPFTEHLKKSSLHRGSRILPRFSRGHWIQGREIRSPTHGSTGSRTKVFDFHSATMQQLESLRQKASERPPRHLRLVFIRHCLQALRLPRSSLEQLISEPVLSSVDEVPAPAPTAVDSDLLPILKSAARCELGLYVSRRQEFYLRRARRRRKVIWKPVLQSISEMSPILEFQAPVAQQDNGDSSGSRRLSPPRPDGAVPRKNISPPRQQVFAAAAKSNDQPPPPPEPLVSATKFSNVPIQQQRSRSTNGSYARSLYMA
ncbi:hypothetical protein M758_1G013500 [Ceratodon purpureus]|nr:hypothetical protein M758_1G013500 [Ceratodon purpureus]